MKRLLFIALLVVFGCEDKDKHGCLDSQACNYEPVATIDNNSCIYISDCAGECGGSAVEDCAGVCDGTTQPEDCTVTDIDGNIYQNVQIGDQLWMAENLKVTHYNDGTEIPTTEFSNSDWGSLSTGAYAVYNDQESNADTYGYLYNWYAVDDDRGVCPEGWHVPTDDEFKELEMYLGMSQEEADDEGWGRGTNEGSKLAGRADLWNDGNLENNPEFGTSGFNLLPGGKLIVNIGIYATMRSFGYLWSSTPHQSNSYHALSRNLYFNHSDFGKPVSAGVYEKRGYSVRCIKD